MPTIGSLVVTLTANAQKYTSGLAGAANKTIGFAQTVGTAAGKIETQMGAALAKVSKGVYSTGSWVEGLGKKVLTGGLAAQAGLGLMVKSFADWGDQVAKDAKRTGLSTEALSELGYVAGLSGSDMEGLSTAIKKMNVNLGAMGEEKKPVVLALAELGMTMDDLAGKNTEQKFLALADGFSRMTDPGRSAAAAVALFGKAGQGLLPMLQQGAGGMAFYRAEAQRLGVSLSAGAAANAETLNDMMGRVTASWTGLKNTVASALAPAFIQMTTRIANLVSMGREYIAQHPAIITGFWNIVRGATAAGLALMGIGIALKGISYLLTPGGLLAVAAGVLLYLGLSASQSGKSFAEMVGAYQIGGRSISEWIGTLGTIWNSVLPVLQVGARLLGDIFDSVWLRIELGFDRLWRTISLNLAVKLGEMTQTLYAQDSIAANAAAHVTRAMAEGFRRSGGAQRSNIVDLAKAADASEANLQTTWVAFQASIGAAMPQIAQAGKSAFDSIAKSAGFTDFATVMAQVNRGFPEMPKPPEVTLPDLADAANSAAGKTIQNAALERGSMAAYSAVAQAQNAGQDAQAKDQTKAVLSTAATLKLIKAQLDKQNELAKKNVPIYLLG